jgi:GntR family transcriptional regulator
VQILIDPRSDRPVYQQIIDHIKREIALKRLLPGEQLPTVRELAQHLVINPNTIGKAYKYLEQEGILTTRPGAGAFVSQEGSRLSQSAKKKIVCELLDRAAVERVTLQVEPSSFRQWFETTAKQYEIDQ